MAGRREPGVHRTPNGRWRADLPPAVGAAFGKGAQTFDTYAAAVVWRRETVARVAADLVIADPTVTVAELAHKWLTTSTLTIKDSTRQGWLRMLARFVDDTALGAMRVGQVRPADIDATIALTPENNTRVRCIGALTSFFKWATDNDYVLRDPVARSGAARARQLIDRNAPARALPNTNARWTLDQVGAFVRFEHDPVYRLAWLLYIVTGARRGEVAGLTWPHVHLDQGLLNLQWNVTECDGVIVIEKLPKARTERPCYLGPFTVKALSEHADGQATLRDAAPVWDDRAWVLDRRRQRPAYLAQPGLHLDPSLITQRLHRHTDRLGLPRLSGAHGLRRSFATYLREQKLRPVVIKQMMGHALTLTEKYDPASEDELRDGAARIDDELARQLA
jgi:integrase